MADETTPGAPGVRPGSTPLPRHLAYRQVRRYIKTLLWGRPGAAAPRVPGCPGWSVRDTVAHLTQNCRTAEANLLDGSRRPAGLPGLGLPELLAEWERSAVRVEYGLSLSTQARAGSVLVMDAFTHAIDIARALGEPFPADHPALPDAFDVVFDGFNGAVRRRCLPPLSMRTEQARWTAGEQKPTVYVTGTWIDLYRSLVGRRTAQQIRSLAWSGDPEPWLPAFAWGPFRLPSEPVE